MTTRRRHSLLRVLSLEDRTVPSTVQGTVFNDANHNGVLDAGETGLSGWAAYLDRNQNGIIDPGETTAITDAAGNYFFDTTNEAPALVAYGDVYDAVAVKIEVGTGGRYLDTTARGNYAGRITQPNAVLNFGTFFQPTVGVAPAGPETLVNATAAGVQGGASVSADAAGDYVIAWNTDQPGGGHAIVARIFNADGTPRTAEITVATTATSSNTGVAMAGNGNQFVVSWCTAQGLKAQVFNSQGAPVGGTATVLAFDAKTTGSLDKIAADATGNFVVLYNVRTYNPARGWSSTHTLKAQLYTASGTANGRAITVASPTLVNGSEDLAMAGGGNFVVVWNEVYQIYAQRYTASGSKSGSQIIVASVPAVSPTTIWEPSVAMNATGRFVVTYEFTGSPEKFLAQTYNVNGTPAGTPVSFGSGDAYGSTGAQVAMDSAGNETFAWTHGWQNGEYQGFADVHMSRLAAGATVADPVTMVNTTTQGSQAGTILAATGNGSFVVAWQGFGPGDDAGIFAQRYEPLPPPLPPPGGGGRFTSAEGPNKSHSVAALFGQSAQDRANFPPFFVGGGTLPAFEVFHDSDDVNDISLAFASTVSHRRFDVIDLKGWATRFTALLGVETIY